LRIGGGKRGQVMEAESGALQQKKGKIIAIIRLKGRVNVKEEDERTLQMLNLRRKYSMAIYPADLPGLDGMLDKVKHLVTWGEVSEPTLEKILRKRGRLPGRKRLNDEVVKQLFNVESVADLASKIYRGEIILHKQEKIKPVFRLHPPRGGFKRSTRRTYENGGELGYRGEAINDLILKMI
jgi:large subunit ribosomal protein L30